MDKPMHPLRVLRKEQGLTQAEFSILTNISPTIIAQVEGGFRKLSVLDMDRLNCHFGIETDVYLKQETEYREQYRKFLIESKLN